MADVLSPYYVQPPPPPTQSPQKSNLAMLYYGLIIIGTAAVVLAIYNLIIIKWCTHRHQEQAGERPTRFLEVTTGGRQSSMELSSFKYRKDNTGGNQEQGSDYECAVCLSVFEEGEEVRQLPGCNHSFHASCIDMWLYSHSDCPLCRSHVDPPSSFCHRHRVVGGPTAENSQENLLGANAHFIHLV